MQRRPISDEPLNRLGEHKPAVVDLMRKYERRVEAGGALNYSRFVDDIATIYGCDRSKSRDIANDAFNAVIESGMFRDVANALDLLQWHDGECGGRPE